MSNENKPEEQRGTTTTTLAQRLAACEATEPLAAGPTSIRDGIDTAVVSVARFLEAAQALAALGYTRFIDLTAVDLVEYLPEGRDDRFEVQLVVYSMTDKKWARVKTRTASKVPSVTSVHPFAYNFEREVYDLLGVVFDGHPSLTRLMLPEGWQGHPLRRDAEAPFEPVDFTVTRELYKT